MSTCLSRPESLYLFFIFQIDTRLIFIIHYDTKIVLTIILVYATLVATFFQVT